MPEISENVAFGYAALSSPCREERNLWPDYAKAIGIALVVYGHVARGLVSAGLPVDKYFFDSVDSIVYSFHMPLFFCLSGLFFYDSLTRWGKAALIARKVDTIVYPYVVWSLLQGFCEVALANYTNGHVTVAEVLAFAWHPRAQFWFLYALFLIFVLSAFVYSWSARAYFGAVAAVFGLLYVFKSSIPLNLVTNLVCSNAVFFALGVWLNERRALLEARSTEFALVFGVLFAVAQYLFHFELGLDYSVGGLPSLLLASISIGFVISLSMSLGRFRMNWLLLIGASSMNIYLMHVLVGSGTRVLLKRLFGVESISAHLVLGTLLGVTVPLLAQYAIKRFGLSFLLAPPKWISGNALLAHRARAMQTAD